MPPHQKRAWLALLALLAGSTPIWSQSHAADALLSGVVIDPSGAKIVRAEVHVQGGAVTRDILSDSTGRFGTQLPGGAYDITVSFPGFQNYEAHAVELPSGERLELPVYLTIPTHREEVTVPSDASAATDPDANLGALTFRGSQLQIFSEDNDIFGRQLAAITGNTDLDPSQIYVDGFSGGRVPPKSAIREIRINQNPFSAQYDRTGLSRIDILTKPGTASLHGDISFSFNNNALNSRNPFIVGTEPPYHTTITDGSINGPLGHKTSFFASGNHAGHENNAVVNAVVLDDNLAPAAFSQAVPNPQISDIYSTRVDHQFSPSNTLTARYEFYRLGVTNGGLGALILPSEAYNSSLTTQTLQLGETHTMGPRLVSETRFQYIRVRNQQAPVSNSPSLIVEGSFSGGGNPGQNFSDHQDHFEFQQHFSWDRGAHFIRAGARYRLLRDANLSTANYNGQYLFGGGTAPELDANNNPVLDAGGNPVQQTITGLEQYSRSLICQAQSASGLQPGGQSAPICAEGGLPSQFNLTAGQPSASVLTGDLGAYAEDNWRLRKNLTLTLGVRFESQFAIPDHWDPAPRVGLAWAIMHGKSKVPLLVLRPAFGIFYDRFTSTNLLQAIRQNGTSEQAYYIQSPQFCSSLTSTCNPAASAAVQQPTIYQIDPHLRSQYDIVADIAAEHSFGRHGSISANYFVNHGVHQFLSRNGNAPLPGTFNPNVPNSGVRPLGGTQNIYQYSSNGDEHIRLFSTTVNYIPTRHIYLTGIYVAQRNLTDSGGASTFVSNSYNASADYGRTGLFPAQRVAAGGQWKMPWGFGLSSLVTYHQGVPFNITTGDDLNGDTLYNDRPAFATDLTRASVRSTAFGNFDVSPLPTQMLVPINFGISPSYVSWNTYFDTSIKLGPRHTVASASSAASTATKAPATERPFMLGLSVEVENLLNHVNPAPPIGVLNSPLFGQSISLADRTNNTAANRTISLRVFFTF